MKESGYATQSTSSTNNLTTTHDVPINVLLLSVTFTNCNLHWMGFELSTSAMRWGDIHHKVSSLVIPCMKHDLQVLIRVTIGLLKINLYDFTLYLIPWLGYQKVFKLGLGKCIWFSRFNIPTSRWLFLFTFPTWVECWVMAST
jgi:hypothetical protein